MNRENIMVVDDDASVRSMLSEYLSSVGYDVTVAIDGEDALKKFIPKSFDCIITDLFMPKMNGLELLKKIRSADNDVLFLMITGYPGIDSAVKAMNEGAYDYITKPFHMDDMLLKVERALHNRKMEKSLRKMKLLLVSLTILTPLLIGLGVLLGSLWNGK